MRKGKNVICKKNNHIEKDCYYKNKKQNKIEIVNNVVLLTNETHNNNIWIVDSGSSFHVTR